MKKVLFLSAWAAMMLGAVSCSNDMEPELTNGTVQFKVELPGAIDSRAISDGTTAKKLDVACYDADGNKLAVEPTVKTDFTNREATVTYKLVKGQKYKFAFFAHADGAPYTFSAGTKLSECNFTVDYTTENKVNCNDEKRDAFFGVLEDYEVTAEVTEVKLHRPFAQLNFGTDDLTAAQTVGFDPDQSQVVVSKVGTTFNLSTGKTSGEKENVTFALAALPADPATLTVGGTTYAWMAMNYFLAPADDAIIEATMTAKKDSKTAVVPVSNVPVKKNHRTNIIGSLFTEDANIKVIIEPAFEEPDLEPEQVWDGKTRTEIQPINGVYTINSNEEMAYVFQDIATLSKATKVVINKDLNMGLKPFNGIGQWEKPSNNLTIDGQNHVIKGLVETLLPHYNTSSALEIKDLTITDSAIEYDLNSADFTHVGGFVGWIGENWTSVNITNCHLTNSSVKGSDQNGGIFGYATGSNKTMNVTDCSVENCEIWSKENCAPLCGNGTGGSGTLVVTNFKSLNNTVTSEKTGGPEKLRAGSVIATVSTGTVKFYNLTAEGNTVKAGGNVMTTIYGRYIGGSIYIDDELLPKP